MIDKIQITSTEEMVGAIEELSLQRMLFRYDGYINKINEWASTPPREVLAGVLDRMPSVVEEISANEAFKMVEKTLLDNGRLSVFDHGTPTEVEAYFIFKLVQLDKGTLNIDSIDNNEVGDDFLPRESIRCLRDSVRTRKFISAIRDAVDGLSNKKDVVHVLDAGSGAFPIMAIMAALQSDKVQCVCIENNELSVRMANSLIDALGLASQITIVQADATTYVPEHTIDLLVSETMDSGLTSEQQCSIQNHLAQYMSDYAVFLPSRIETFATVVSKDTYIDAEGWYKIDQTVYPKLKYNWVKTGEFNPGHEMLDISGNLQNNSQGDALVLVSSKVHLGDTYLDISESRITMPIVAGSISKEVWSTAQRDADKEVRILYKPGADLDKIILS